MSRILLVLALGLCRAGQAGAQPADAGGDAFAQGGWRFETQLFGAIEAWNYNRSNEQLLGVREGVTYGLRDGLLLVVTQHIYYVSQRANDTWLLGLTAGIRQRLYHRGPLDLFVDLRLGISDAAIATPPRGTRLNYLAIGAGGAIFTLRPRLHLIAGLDWIHISNAGLKGPDRNPDIQAIGPTAGVLVGW